MKKLNRCELTPPDLLSIFDYNKDKWSKVNRNKKKKLWGNFYNFQHEFCVYCESKAVFGNGHIEHFYCKGNEKYANLTFDWDNLFGCCDSKEHCGHYKDQTLPGGKCREYDEEMLIKPDLLDPTNYLQFLPTGQVVSKLHLSELDKQKAEVTIDTLNLKISLLVNKWKKRIDLFEERLSVLLKYKLSNDILLVEYEKMRSEAESGEYSTAVIQTLFN